MNNQEPFIFRYLLGDREAFPLERRVLNALILASSLLASLLVIEAIVFGYHKGLALSLFAASIFWGIYLFSKKAINSDWPIWAYLSASGIVILADRFFVGGHAGLALLILVAISGTIPLVTRTDQLKTAATLVLLFFGFVCTLTAMYWFYIPTQTPDRKELLVQVFEAGVLMSCLFSVAYLAINSYRQEKKLVSTLNLELSTKNASLEESNRKLVLAKKEIKTLRGLLPTCSYCKKIRPENLSPEETCSWVPIEHYIEQHTDAVFSHGICPECLKDHFGEEMHKKIFENPAEQQ